MTSPRTVFLVPRRNDGGPRDRLWTYARARWERHLPEVAIFEGHHERGSFNRAAAINRAARAAGDWDIGIVIDSDVMLSMSQARAAIERAAETGRVTWGHRRWRGFHESWTNRWVTEGRHFGPELDRDEMDLYVERTNPLSWSCFIAIPRPVFDDLGGFDERFRGWGFEDMAFQSVVAGLYGHERIEGDIVHLFHPRSDERIILGETRSTASDDYIRNGLLGRRYMFALRRDHGGHDRAAPASEAERERDMRNIVRDDRKFLDVAARRGMPEAAWSDWWPTLPELRDGARAAALATDPITVVVTSGGTADTWPERRGYLAASLASLTEHVSGSIAQRVVYADWPDEVRAELEDVARQHGFYVAGEGHHGHTQMRQRLWRYLARHATGDLVFGTEDDFVYEQPVNLDELAAVLEADPHLAQIALLRDACYPDERETGGILGWPEPAFTRVGTNGTSRLEHRLFWTNNPSLFRRSLTGIAWPATREDPKTGRGPGSEVIFGRQLAKDERVRFAFWGDGTNQVRHIGTVRAGTGY